MKETVLLLCLLSVCSVNASTQKVTIQITGIREQKGNVIIGIYDDAELFGRDGSEIRKLSVPVDSEKVTVTMEGLKEGEYAFAVVHDKNGNGKCDYNMLGIPKESFGFSNNVRPKWKIPSFNDVKVNVEDGTILRIKLLDF